MIARRDLLIGAACLSAAGAAYALEPRKRQVLLSGAKMAEILPIAFGEWSAEETDGLVRPPEDGTLSAALYSELIGRAYLHKTSGAAIMMLAAYGDTQSDMLQLHRPEACYPAVGFRLISTVASPIKVAPNVSIPARRVVVTAPGRQENIVYWARLGEFLPASGAEQREDRLRAALRGNIPDGVLIRFSALGDDPEAAFKMIDEFVPALLAAVPAQHRRALIGTERAKALQA